MAKARKHQGFVSVVVSPEGLRRMADFLEKEGSSNQLAIAYFPVLQKHKGAFINSTQISLDPVSYDEVMEIQRKNA